MTPEQIILLVIQFCVSATVLLLIAGRAASEREQKHAYRLYALRDRLLYLKATDQLRESDLLFKVFYNAITNSISELGKVTLYALIKASLAAKSALEKEKSEKLSAAIRASNSDVRQFVVDFAETMMGIMKSNSPTLYCMLFVGYWCGALFKAMRDIHPPFPAETRETYHAYEYFKNIYALAH